MRGVCIDVLNQPWGNPSPKKLLSLMPNDDGVRQVLMPGVEWRLRSFALNGIQIAVVVARESLFTGDYWRDVDAYARALLSAGITPLWLIGNEPNAPEGSPSSWTMSPKEYAALWNGAVGAIKRVAPDAPCCIGGLLGQPAQWLDATLPLLDVQPDGLDTHYPEREEDLQFYGQYGLPLSVMEWNYVGRGVTREKFVAYAEMLERYAQHTAWFCYHYIGGDVGYMSLLSPTGHKRKAWYDFNALF